MGILSPKIPEEYSGDYRSYKFYRNNIRILVVSMFLIFEQLFYGIFISTSGSRLQAVYLYSALTMFFFSMSSLLFYVRNPVKLTVLHRLYEMSLGLFGLAIALVRFIFVEFNADVFHIPTVYIAVIYGLAVVSFYRYWQSFLCYAVLSAAAVYLMLKFHPRISCDEYIADIVSNGAIAWIVSIINYRNFVKDYLNKKIIEKNNADLIEKNSHIEKINIELREQSVRDGLTGLFNRRKLDEEIRNASIKAGRYSQDFAIIIMDIDYFKNVNDTYGHDAGDVVLKEIGQILMENIRDADVCGRWGGEEFMIICPEINISHAYLLAERLRQLIGTYSFSGALKVTASFGIATFKEFSDARIIIKQADSRLYDAKMLGRNRVVGATVHI